MTVAFALAALLALAPGLASPQPRHPIVETHIHVYQVTRHFDVAMDAFGPDRLIFGSNWPVVNLGGSFAKELALAEEYLRARGTAVRDKVMFQNAQKFYRRSPP